MWSTDPVLTLWCLTPVSLGGIYMRWSWCAFFGMIRESMQLLARLSDRVLESYTGIGTVRAHAVEAAAIERFEERNGEYLRLQLRITALRSFGMPVLGVSGMVAAAIVLWVGGQQVIDGELQGGEPRHVHRAARRRWWACSWGSRGCWRPWGAASSRCAASTRCMHEPASACPPGGRLRHSSPAARSSCGASRSPTPTTTSTGAGQTCRPPSSPGRTLGIFGKTGSGKTTLVNLLARVHTPPPGAVWLDGHDATRLDLHRLREAMAVVPQSPFLFSTTLRENIRLRSASQPVADGEGRPRGQGTRTRTTRGCARCSTPRASRTTCGSSRRACSPWWASAA
jgi:ATP-binding cassette subfamily B multidrug efflux pump